MIDVRKVSLLCVLNLASGVWRRSLIQFVFHIARIRLPVRGSALPSRGKLEKLTLINRNENYFASVENSICLCEIFGKSVRLK